MGGKVPEPNPSRTGTWLDELDMIDTDVADDRVQRLLEASHGVCLVLESLSERDEIQDVNILVGLASALRLAAEECAAAYFRSAGDIARTLEPQVITALLEREIERIREERQSHD